MVVATMKGRYSTAAPGDPGSNTLGPIEHDEDHHYNGKDICRPCCFLNPKEPFFQKWDIVMLVALLYTALYTPFEVSFLEEIDPLSSVSFRNISARLIDLFFMTDVVFNFFMSYPDAEGICIKTKPQITTTT